MNMVICSSLGVVPRFSDLEVIALNMTSEAIGIDSESFFFAKLEEDKDKIPNLISRRQYNDRRKFTASLCNTIRQRIANEIDGGEEYFCVDSKPIEVCRPARGRCCSMGKNDIKQTPSFGYFASQEVYYYAKEIEGLFTRIIGKISALTILLQYINYKNGRSIGRIKYALI